MKPADDDAPSSTPPVTAGPESAPDFKRGRYLGLIVFVVAVVIGLVAVAALSGMFATKKRAMPKDPYEDNKEGGCPCSCDRSKAMASEVRALGGDRALSAIEKSLATIKEREEAGFVTEAMVQHRLRLLDLERDLRQSGAITSAPKRALPFGDIDPAAWQLEPRAVGDLRVGMALVVHGELTEWIASRQKLQRACFVLSIALENRATVSQSVDKPLIRANVPLAIRRWYVRGENGEPWDGHLGPHEQKWVHVIGYVEAPIPPQTEVSAEIQFAGVLFHAKTRARSRWNRVEATYTSW